MNPQVARYILSFPQTKEFIARISELLVYLIPHYIREGKSYLTIAFGCTGGKHRSVLIAEEVKKRLAKAGYNVKVVHRDSPVGARFRELKKQPRVGKTCKRRIGTRPFNIPGLELRIYETMPHASREFSCPWQKAMYSSNASTDVEDSDLLSDLTRI